MDGDIHGLLAHHDLRMVNSKNVYKRFDTDDYVDGLRVLEVLVA